MKQYLEQIERNEENGEGEFYISSAGKHIGQLFYELKDDSKMIITHTEVDGELKGTDAAKSLVFKAADHARSNDLDVVPECSYANTIFQRYDELQDVYVEK